MGSDKTTITASGKMGEYGKVYVSYNMTYAADGVSGAVEGVGRGVVDADTVMTGRFTGVWRREGSTVTMHNTVNMNDGSQNFLTWQVAGEPIQLSCVACGDVNNDGTPDICLLYTSDAADE